MDKNSFNQANLMGHVGSDPELSYTKNGIAMCKFNLATNESFKDSKDRTEWHKIVIFGDRAEKASELITKGKQIMLTGKITTSKWEDKDGNARYTTSIMVNSWTFIGRKSEDSPKKDAVPDDDLPF